jgi:hypothetical protein
MRYDMDEFRVRKEASGARKPYKFQSGNPVFTPPSKKKIKKSTDYSGIQYRTHIHALPLDIHWNFQICYLTSLSLSSPCIAIFVSATF